MQIKFQRRYKMNHSKEIQLIEIKYGAEAIIRFMGEIKNPKYNSFERLRQFLFYTLNYEKKIFIRKRKFKKMIPSVYKWYQGYFKVYKDDYSN